MGLRLITAIRHCVRGTIAFRMQRITRTILWAVIFEALNLLAQAQDSASSPQKLAADQTSAPDSVTSASTASAQQGQVSAVPGSKPPSPSTQNGAEVIVKSIPVLTIDEAVALAVKGNRQ